MKIHASHTGSIRRISIDSDAAVCDYNAWQSVFFGDAKMTQIIEEIERRLGTEVLRSQIVNFYKEHPDPLLRFTASMIWGHAQFPGGRGNSHAPTTLRNAINRSTDFEGDLQDVRLGTEKDAIASYELLTSTRNGHLGPELFSIHFYFLAKFEERKRRPKYVRYPVILDDHTSMVLSLLASPGDTKTSTNSQQPTIDCAAYFEYVQWIGDQAYALSSDPDQVEIFVSNTEDVTTIV